jgi:hypothetical protein
MCDALTGVVARVIAAIKDNIKAKGRNFAHDIGWVSWTNTMTTKLSINFILSPWYHLREGGFGRFLPTGPQMIKSGWR